MDTDYRLLDTGRERRLEQIGDIRIVRNAKQAFWSPALSKDFWDQADAFFDGESWYGSIPECEVKFGSSTFSISLMDGGQIGIFPEQIPNWHWLEKITENMSWKIINGFGYTGASTVFASHKTNTVTHLDASRTSVNRAKENLRLSGKEDNSVRFIVDDVLSFLRKEVSRGNTYDGFIFDPPAFGRGGKGKTWKLTKDMPELLELMQTLSGGKPSFALLTAHDSSMDENILADTLKQMFPPDAVIEKGPLIMKCESGRDIKNGYFARCVLSQP